VRAYLNLYAVLTTEPITPRRTAFLHSFLVFRAREQDTSVKSTAFPFVRRDSVFRTRETLWSDAGVTRPTGGHVFYGLWSGRVIVVLRWWKIMFSVPVHVTGLYVVRCTKKVSRNTYSTNKNVFDNASLKTFWTRGKLDKFQNGPPWKSVGVTRWVLWY